MLRFDRRTPPTHIRVQRRMGLTRAQELMMMVCEDNGWTLRFVRGPLEHPTPVMFAGEQDYLVVRADGSIDDDIQLRH
ncbi:hypothetical protein [Lysobacter niastensis]|uniref:Uncharacterized protein n=1 Tax=Lysobacter niastensis TaxID=380629 RepID=A0ABS0B6J9_9GAMM|nr:hypothetical protein [Lysobacter niastensis]MBF6024658.1 hypothetical protein [Lysobacter niastensis]